MSARSIKPAREAAVEDVPLTKAARSEESVHVRQGVPHAPMHTLPRLAVALTHSSCAPHGIHKALRLPPHTGISVSSQVSPSQFWTETYHTEERQHVKSGVRQLPVQQQCTVQNLATWQQLIANDARCLQLLPALPADSTPGMPKLPGSTRQHSSPRSLAPRYTRRKTDVTTVGGVHEYGAVAGVLTSPRRPYTRENAQASYTRAEFLAATAAM